MKIAPGFVSLATTMVSKSATSLQTTAPTALEAASMLPFGESAVHSIISTIRGGTAASSTAGAAVIDFSRECLYAQGIATYATVTALIMNASLRLWTSTKFSKDQRKIVSNVFHGATALCILSGTFTAILFQLLTIYYKSALSMGTNDGGYLAFKAATKAIRVWGFRCFLTEAIGFGVSVVAQLYNTLWEDARQQSECKSALTVPGKVVLGGSIGFVLVSVFAIRSVLKLAAEHVYRQ